MRNRLAQLATGSTMVLVLSLSPASWAQQSNPAAARNPAAGQNTNQASAETETIHGVIAGITAEGEAMFDYRTNRAVAAEATFLTVVGSPMKEHASEANRRDSGAANRREAGASDRESSHRRRHNVYYVWLSPKTKICEDWTEHGKAPAAGGTESSAQKKEVAIDNLEVGDHVEIQFVRNDDSTANAIHRTEQMTRKHGRHRTYVGHATAVTILAARQMTSANPETKSNREIPK